MTSTSGRRGGGGFLSRTFSNRKMGVKLEDEDDDHHILLHGEHSHQEHSMNKRIQAPQSEQAKQQDKDAQATIRVLRKDLTRLIEEKARLEMDYMNQMTKLSVENERLKAENAQLKKKAAQASSKVVSSSLWDSITDLRTHVSSTPEASKAVSALDEQLSSVRVAGVMEPRHTMLTKELAHSESFQPPKTRGRTLVVSNSTWPANDPSEDRSSVVVGDGFIFCGVYDGHGGTECSTYTQKHVFRNFRDAFEAGASVGEAYTQACQKTDKDYLEHARALNNPEVLFAGTCFVSCYVDSKRGSITCANLGDSRAVMGLYSEEQVSCVALSNDHTASCAKERNRIRNLHKHDPDVIVQLSPDEDDPDWRVKKIAAFTRSIGDTQLKDRASAALYNSYLTPQNRIYPRPGVKAKSLYQKTPPYLSNEPEIKEVEMPKDGFIIIACDGVWDEMSSEEAVNIVAELFSMHEGTETNIAECFVEETLHIAADRIAQTYEGGQDMTLDKLRACPQGKKTDWSRSCLHDDITVLIVRFGGEKGFKSFDASISAESFFSLPSHDGGHGRERRGGRRSGATSNKMHSSMSDFFFAVSDEIKKQKEDELRQTTNKQIMAVMETFEGMNPAQLKMIFHALDVDGNGTLDRDEIGRLMSQVLKTDVTDLTVDTFFSEMDSDGSGDIDFNEFTVFFGYS